MVSGQTNAPFNFIAHFYKFYFVYFLRKKNIEREAPAEMSAFKNPTKISFNASNKKADLICPAIDIYVYTLHF